MVPLPVWIATLSAVFFVHDKNKGFNGLLSELCEENRKAILKELVITPEACLIFAVEISLSLKTCLSLGKGVFNLLETGTVQSLDI